MSRHTSPQDRETERTARHALRRRDVGMTLMELLVTVSILAIIGAVIGSAIIAVFKQSNSSRGRTVVAGAEQSVNLWMPSDLASAATVDTAPQATPCGSTVCDGISLSGGSNVILLSWTTQTATGTTSTNVSYNFAPAADGTYQLRRVKCVSEGAGIWNCENSIVLRDLPGPPGGATFVPGVQYGAACNSTSVKCTRPEWVITVSQPLDPAATSAEQFAATNDKNANRVVVTINGGGSSLGAGGGINQISITAGGAVRSTIDANSVQGAPSFTSVRSRCGGAITVVVDESNSIGSYITNVRAGVKQFVQTLAGTPTKIQIVGFHTFSRTLGTTGWHKYFDMTNESDVTALVAAVDNLVGSWSTTPNGGTNWEEALFRVLRNANGTTADLLPNTVVFFTDGVPTFNRLVQRTSPGVLPADPEAALPPWPVANGSAYNQVAFERARYLADLFRTSVRFIGVGVGSSITSSSTWISDPGAGYRTVWERGSYRYVRDTTAYQLRFQRKNTSTGPWYWVNKATYDATSASRRQDLGWTNVTEATYLTVENPVNAVTTDGAQVATVSTPISTAEFNAQAGQPGYRAVTKTWAAGPDWEVWTGDRSSGLASEYRSSKVYNSPPYEAYDPAVTATTTNSIILARLIAGNDYGTPALFNGTTYTNPQLADMYILPEWSQFVAAMSAVSLGQCGGTLTLQTKRNGTAVGDPFRYQNTATLDSTGNNINVDSRVVTTNLQFITGTFDFSVPNGQFLTVEVMPQNYSELTGYQPVNWSCKAGVTTRSFTTVAIPGQTAWTGIRVRVAANEAVSCTLNVTRT